MSQREPLVERTGARIAPLLLEMGHPPPAEEDERPLAHRRIRDPLTVELAKTNLLLHGPTV